MYILGLNSIHSMEKLLFRFGTSAVKITSESCIYSTHTSKVKFSSQSLIKGNERHGLECLKYIWMNGTCNQE